MRYEYRCQNCKYEFEMVVPIDCLATTQLFCPVCYSDDVKKKYNLFTLIFKGDGFYKTDSKKSLTKE